MLIKRDVLNEFYNNVTDRVEKVFLSTNLTRK